jgi:hypothetical protein
MAAVLESGRHNGEALSATLSAFLVNVAPLRAIEVIRRLI